MTEFTPADGVRRPIRPSKRIVLIISAVGIALWLYVGLVLLLLGHNRALIPVWMIIGSFTLAVTLLTVLTRRLGSATTLTPRFLLTAFTVGGFTAVLVGGSLDTITVDSLGRIGGLSLAGFVEEAAKIAVVVFLCRRLPDKTIRNGMLVAGAVALGFSALEDLGYALEPFLTGGFTAHTIITGMGNQVSRVISGPFAHPLWTSLLAAAVFASVRDNRFRFTPTLIFAYIGVAITHGLFDAVPVTVTALRQEHAPTLLQDLALVGGPVVIVLEVIACVIWFRITRRVGKQYREQLPNLAPNTQRTTAGTTS